MKKGDKVKLLERTGEFSDDFKKGEILEIVSDRKFGYRCRSASGKEKVINASSLVLYPTPISEMKAEELQHADGRKVILFQKLSMPTPSGHTHCAQLENGLLFSWKEFDTCLIPIKKERWQGMRIRSEGKILFIRNNEYDSFESALNQFGKLNAAYNLDTKEIRIKEANNES